MEEEVAATGVAEARRLEALEEENWRLKQHISDLSFDKHILQDALKRKP